MSSNSETLTATAIQAQLKSFRLAMRGCAVDEVGAFFMRIGLALDVIGDHEGELPALPPDFEPEAIRTKKFTMVWRGFDQDEVRAYLDQVAAALQDRIDNPPVIENALHLPDGFLDQLRSARAVGVFEGAEVGRGSRRMPVTFFVLDRLVESMQAGVAEQGVAMFSTAIVVDDLSERSMHAAFDKLNAAGELDRLFNP